MNRTDKLQTIYSALQNEGYTDLGDFSAFSTMMEDENNLRLVYDGLVQSGYEDVGDFSQFKQAINPIETQPTDSTYKVAQGRFGALVDEETPEEKAAKELKAQERRQRRRDGINSVFAATMPGMVSNEYVQSQMKTDVPAEPTEEQKKAAEDERLFKQHLEDSGQIQELYNLRDYARENDGSNGIWDYVNPLGEKAPIGGAIHLLRSAFSEDYRNKKQAQKRNRLIAEQADKAIDVYEQATGDRNGISSVFNAVADEASRISTWDLGMTDLQNAATLYELSQKDESELTASEKATLDAIGLASSVMSLYGDEVGMGYKIGQGVPATLSFMGSMALNPAAGYGKKLAGDAVKKFGKDYVKRVAKRAAGDILETGAYVGSVALPQVAANALDRINGSTTYDLDDDLNVVYGGQEDQEALGDAIWKAFGETFIEGHTERVGDYFDPIIGFAKGVTKGVKAGKLSDFAEALVEVKPTATMQNIRRFKEKTLFNGTLSELMEEELGMAMNAFTVGDYTFDKEKAEKEGKTYIFDPENQFVTAMSVGMFSAAINGTEMAANHAYKRKVNKTAEEKGKIAERELGAQFSEMIDGVPSLKERIDNADADEKNRIINDIFASPNLSDKQKQAAATYAVYRQYAQTFNAVQANALNHKADEVKEQHAAYEAGYSSALPAFYNIANAFKEAEQAISDYTEKTGDSSVADAIRLIENNPSEIKNVRDGLTDEQYQLVNNYINTLERYKGAYKGRSDKLEDYVDEYAFALEPAINADANGNRTITTAIYNDEPVYVLYNDGTHATIMKANGDRLQTDKQMLLTRDLSEIVSHDAEQYINDYRQQITGQMDAETENAFKHHPKTQAPQKDLILQSPEGEVVITAVNDNMVEIVPAVYKDGQVQPKEGAEPKTITMDDAYAWQDSYYQGLDDAAAATESQPTVDNMSAETTENEGTPSEQIEQSVSEEVTDSQNVEIQPTEEVVESVAPAVPQTARERVPKDEEGNPIYEQTDADTAWDAIVEETEGDTEMAQRVAADMLEDKKAALAKLQNGKPKKGATVAEKIANEKAHSAAIAQAQNDIAQWEAIVGTEARRREAAMSEAERYAAEMEQKNISEGLKALGEPQSLEEYVLAHLAGGSYKLRWSDKENGTKGFGSHTGLSTEEMKARLSMIDNKNGLTPEEIAHSIVENMDMSFGEVDVMDVTNMVIDAVSTHASRRAMLNGMVESRAELLRQQARAEQEVMDAWYMEQYHATEEELAVYNEYLAEFAEEIYGEDTDYEQRIATFAEIQLEYDNQGTDAGLRSSADQGEGLASDREGGRSVGEREQLDRREVFADAAGMAEAEDGRAGGSVSAESDDRQSRIDRAIADYRENVDDSPEAIAAAERDQKRYEADMADDAAGTVETLENGDVRRTNLNSNGEIATVAIERDGNVISVDTYEDGALFERTDYDANGNATKVTRYKDGEVVSEQEYRDGKRNVTANYFEMAEEAQKERNKKKAEELLDELEAPIKALEAAYKEESKDAINVAKQNLNEAIDALGENVEVLNILADRLALRRSTIVKLKFQDYRGEFKTWSDWKAYDRAVRVIRKKVNEIESKKSNDKLAEKNHQEERKEGAATTGAGKSRPSGTFSISYYTQFLKELFQNARWEERPTEEVAGIIRRHNAGKTLLARTEDERELLSALRALTNNEIQDELSNINNALQSDEYTDEEKEELKRAKNLITRFVNRGERNAVIETLTGAKLGEKLPLSKIDELFEKYNSDSDVAELYGRVRAIAEQIGLDFWFEEMEDRLLGGYLHSDNRVRLNAHMLYCPRMQRQGVASTIVHEMLHAVAGYAVYTQKDIKLGLTPKVQLSKQVLSAANTLINIYEKAVKGNPALVHQEYDIEKEEWVEVADYGTTSVHEMLSEISNPEFRDKLKQIEYNGRSVWQRIWDAIKSMFTQSSDVTNPTAYDSMVKALDVLINEFSVDAYQKYSGLEESAMKLSAEGNLRFRKKEEPKELIAVHNISEDNLKKVLEAGSLIMPSIAITKADMGHTGFGEISLLFDKSTINPSDRRNKVYGGDAWTPRFPRIGVKLNDKVVSRINKKAYELIEDRRLREIFSLSSEVYPDNIEKVISDYGVEGYYNKEWMKLAYLLDNGKKVKIPTKAKDYGIASEDIVRLAKEKGLSVKEIYEDYNFYKNNPDFVAQVKEARDEARLSSIPEEQRDEMRERMQSRPLSEAAFDSYIRGALEMENDLAHGGLKEIVDRQALRDLIEKKVKTDNAEYNKWVDNLFEGIVEKRGIRNNRDWYTPSGNLRPWGQLYDPATPANILKYMLAENEQGGSGGLFDSNIMGASAETYESIEEIREKGKKRLKQLPYEEYDEWSNGIADRMAKICDDFLSPSQKNSIGGAIDAKIEITNAVAKDKTAKGIYKHMKREYPNFTMEHAKQVEEIVKEIQESATGYFEAKPQRLVSVNEVMAAVVPSNASKEIVDALKNNGIEVITYKKGDEEARKRIVKRVSSSMDIRFRDGAPFFSNAERAVENIKQNKATPEQWLAMIKKDGGLKAGEDKWMGLSDWLNEQKENGVKSMTKDEVLQFIRENQIEIEEVEYGDLGDTRLEELQAEFDELVTLGEEETGSIYTSDWADWAFEAMVERHGDDFRNAFRVEQGYNTFPRLEAEEDYDGNMNDAARHFLGVNPINSTRLEYTTEGLDNKQEIALVVPTIESWNESDTVHFGDAGEGRAVAWVRFGETTDEDGNRVLVIDEVQSKRHDEGRAKGYQSKEKGDLLAERDRLYDKMYSDGLTEEEFNRRNEINARLEELGEGRIPDAPFDKNYHELVMKRMLRYAAENGFDKVAWTKGAQQAERYNLGGVVDKITSQDYGVDDNGDAIRLIQIRLKGEKDDLHLEVNKDGIIQTGGQEYEGKHLGNVVGKDTAVKLMTNDTTISGNGLRVGDEGRGALYDEMIPRFMNKYTKKWGTKVGEVTLPNVEKAGRTMWSVDVTPEMRESVMQGQPMFREGMGAISDREVSYENDPIAKFQGKPRYYGKRAAAFAERERRRMENAAKEAAKILGIEVEIITDASALKGRKAKAKGWYDINAKKVVVVVPNHVSKGDAVRTVLHEGVAHHGLRELFGAGFDAMLDNIYNNVAPELKARIDAIAERTGVSTSVATEEYLASLAEDTNFEYAKRTGWWAKIKGYFMKMLRKLSMPGINLKEELTDNELRYLLWRSYKNLVEPNSYLKPLGYIDDVAKQKELKVGNYAEKKQAAPRAAEMSEAEEWSAITMQRIEELEAQMEQLDNEIAEMEADRDADDESRYDMWEEQLDVLNKQRQEIYDELEGLYSLEAEAEEMSMASEDAIRYRLVDDPAEIDRLESEPTIKAYRAMQVINGELYPPMSAVVDGKLREPIALGQWERSEEQPELADDNGRFKLDKGNKKSLKAAYNPYFHSSSTPLNDQFSEAQDRDNLVTVEVEVPASEADGTSGYKAEKAKDAVGTHQWKAGIIQGQLTGTREVFLTRWDKPVRIVPESEVADVIVEMFDGKDIVMPSNVVTPQLRKELETRGITFVETDNQGKLVEGEHKGEHHSKVYGKNSTKKSKKNAEIIAEVERESAALGVPVRIASSVDELPDADTRKRAVDGKLKGYYDPRTNEVVLYAPNTDDANDAKRTILHEIVGHNGLRQLIGEQRYDKAMVQLMYMLPSEVRDAVLRRAERHGWNAAIAMDEYLAEQAERDVQPTWWGKVNAMIRALLRNMGFNVMLTDADVTYLLWRSRKKLQGDTAFDMATDAILKQAARKSAEAEAWNEQAFKDMEMRDFERNALPSIRHRMGADTNDYEKAMRTLGFKQSEAWQDSMRSLLVFQQALAKASGKDISDFENAYMYENRMSSANLMEMEQYRHMVYNPLLKEIHELEQMGASRESIINYLFAKSGLERNEVFARRDAKKHAEGDVAKEQQLYDKYRQKDYAGLTALTRGDAQIAALVDDHSKKKTEYDRLEQNKKRGVAVSDADLKAAKKEMDDARKAMITAVEAEAQRMVDEFEAQHNTDNLWDKIRNCTHTTLNISHDAGVMSDEVYGELWNQFQYYIPLRGFAETTAEDVYLYLGGNDSPYNAPIKTAYGRTSLADDPIATIGNMAESAIVEANRNRLKQRFLYMVERHNTDLASISDVWLEYDEVNDEWHTVFAQIPDDATPSEAKRLQQEFEDRMKQLTEQNPGKYANASQQPNIPYRVVKKGDRQEHHVIVKRNGKDVVITINGNPRVAQAINGLTNPEQNQGMITRITSWINRNLSANFTMRNPAFMVSNFVRDGFYTNSMVWVKENPAYAWQYNQNWMKCTAQIASLVKRYKRYEKGDTTALDMNNDMDRMFYEFMINGGETGYTVIKSVEDYKGLISGEMKKMEAGAMGTARRVADTIGNVVDTFGRWAEDTSRFAAYMTSRQLGRTITKSIWDAKEISVNFNKKGSGNRMMGKFEQGNRLNYVLSNMSQLGRNLYVFWNAGVQGFNNFKKAAKDSPAKFTAMAGTYFTLGVIVAAAFSGDDDEDDYYNLPEYVRRNNICFKIGKGKYATLPLPIEIRAIYGLGELAYSYLSGREGLTHGEAVTKTIQQMTQVMPIDMMADGGGAMALVPSAAKPVVEVIHNVDWTGRPIYKEETSWNKNDPTWTLAFKSTDPNLVKLSRLVNEWTNKNTADGLERPYNRGLADNRYLNNPAVWEHIAEGYLGGIATIALQTKKTLMMPFNEDLREVRNVPIVSRFVKDAGKEGRSYAARNEYYDAKNIMDSWKNEMSKAKKEVLDESLTDEQRLKAAKLRSSLEQQYMEAAERWKVLDRQRKALEEAYKSDQSEENRQALDDVMMQMATLVGAYK